MSNFMAFNFKEFLKSLEAGTVIKNYYDKDMSFIVLEVDCLRERVKMHQSEMPRELARWYNERDFVFNKKI